MSTKVVRWTIAILATILMLIVLAIVGSLVEERGNIIARVLWILSTVLFSDLPLGSGDLPVEARELVRQRPVHLSHRLLSFRRPSESFRILE